MEAWRLVKASRAESAFSGFGAREFGGRWNPKGVSVVYLAEHLSLAALETYVHLPAGARGLPFQAFRVTIPEEVRVEALASADLPAGWRQDPAGAGTQEIGRRWLARADTCLLSVPSTVVPQERNLLVSPAHPDWQRVAISEPEPFFFDPRLTRD